MEPFMELKASIKPKHLIRHMTIASALHHPLTSTPCIRQYLTAETLSALFEGSVLAIHIPNFAPLHEISCLAKRANDLEFKPYEQVWPLIDRVGITVFEFDGTTGKPGYFEAVPGASLHRENTTQGIFDPVKKIMHALASCTDQTVQIAQEEGYGPYFAGLIRRIEAGTLIHIDYAPAEHPGWKVASVTAQLVWNLYLEITADKPGSIRVWNRQWHKADKQYKLADAYGYDPAVVAGANFVDISPSPGDLIVINSRNYHQVSPASGQRIAATSAIGRLPNGEIILWS